MFLDRDFVDVSMMEDNHEEGVEAEEDIIEEGVEAEEEMIDEAETEGRRRRGKDIEWEEMVNFKNNHEFEGSEVKTKIAEFMTKRKEWKTSWAFNLNFTC